jgi:hypothetical protein
MTMPSSETELEDNGTDWGEYARGGGEGVDRYEAELLLMLLSRGGAQPWKTLHTNVHVRNDGTPRVDHVGAARVENAKNDAFICIAIA